MQQSDETPASAIGYDPTQLFRIRGRGYWHIRAHAEYGVVFTLCGIRVLGKETQAATQPVAKAEVCGNCLRHAQ